MLPYFCSNKRYVGDYKEDDMESPSKALHFYQLALKQRDQDRSKIRDLRTRNQRLMVKVDNLQRMAENLRNEVELNEGATDRLLVNCPHETEIATRFIAMILFFKKIQTI